MALLNQIIAIQNGKKSKLQAGLSEIYKLVQKPELFNGLIRRYEPNDDDGERLPDERKHVQYTVQQLLEQAQKLIEDTVDITATQDYANTQARANIEVNGKVLVENVPVTHLLYLEKQLVDLRTLVSKLPTLDEGENWQFDSGLGYYITDEKWTNKTKKVMQNHIVAEATDKHPAQVQVYTEDVNVGKWRTKNMSAAIPRAVKNSMVERVEKLQDAIKLAREQANTMEVEQKNVAKPLLDFVLNGTASS